MKKILTLAFGLLVMSFAANAQSTDSFLRLGIKGGANFSNIIKDDGNNNFETKYITGYNVGLTLDVKLLENLAITPELLYSTKGYELRSSFGTHTTKTDFIEIPILASIRLGGGLNVVAGPQISFLTSTTNTFENGFLTSQERVVEAESERFKKSLLGGVIGFRYDFSRNVGLFGRYALDFQKNNEDGTTTTPEFKNQVFSVGLGYKF